MFSIDGNNRIRREADGSVVIEHDGDHDIAITFSADDWISMVTSVAHDADKSETYEAARMVHEEASLCDHVFESDCHGIEMIKSPSGKEWAIGGTNTRDRWSHDPWCGKRIAGNS